MPAIPVTESTLSANYLAQLLQEKYGLGANTTCKLFRTGMNHLYHVNDGATKFALRIYTHNWRTKVDVSEEVRLLIHLKNNNAPVTYPIADSNGEYVQEFNAPEGIRYGVLFSFAKGEKNARFNVETSYQIGVALAKIHRLTENWKMNRITYDPQTLLTDSLNRTKAFFTNPSEEITFIEKLTNYLFKEYEKVNEKQVRCGALHLDFWFDNMHFFEETEITVFDFDFSGNGWLCHDISYYLYQLYSTNQNESQYETKLQGFLKGYETVSKITDEERRIIPFTCLGVMLFYISMQCDRYDTWSNIFLNEDHLKRFVGSLKRWIAYNRLNIDDGSI